MNDKNKILDNTRQGLSIFEYYIPELKQHGTKKNFKAVFRNDGENPDANVFQNKKNKQWYYRDFVSGETLSPFDFVMKKESCDFKTALDIIVNNVCQHLNTSNEPAVKQTDDIKILSIIESDDYQYWERYIGEKEKIKDFATEARLISIKECIYLKNNKKVTLTSSTSSPIFAFKISEDCYKIYQPLAEKKNQKHWWLGNKPVWYNNLYGIELLKNNLDFVLIVEGYKDSFVANANGINAVCVDNAATIISKPDITAIQAQCKNIILCYDNDTPGKNGCNKMAKEYHLPIISLTKDQTGENGKDISDYFLNGNSADALKTIANDVLEQHTNAFETKKLSKLEQIEEIIMKHFEIRYNEITNSIEYLKKGNSESNYEVLNENNIFRFLQHQNTNISMAKLQSLLRSDFVPKYNRFEIYFNNLKDWDQNSEPDYINKLCAYLPVIDSKRFLIQFRKALVRTVACSINPEIVNKQAIILVHDVQNSGKSTFIRWLCPQFLADYIAENISVDKDSLIALCENFIINMDELATLSKAEINSLKSLLSKKDVKVRRPYDKVPIKSIRRASFFGSTNVAEFLSDETGNVRWLCFELFEKINWDYCKDINIDDIWRQAYNLYKTGFEFELTQAEIIENEIANQQFMITTNELQLIQKHFSPGKDDKNSVFFTSTDISNYIRGLYPGIVVNTNNIGKALKILGFARESKRKQELDYPIKGYYVTKNKSDK